MKMEKVCQLLVANFKESCGGETLSFSLCKYFSENIQTRDNDKNLVSGPRKKDYKYHLPLLGACEESSFAPSVCFVLFPNHFKIKDHPTLFFCRLCLCVHNSSLCLKSKIVCPVKFPFGRIGCGGTLLRAHSSYTGPLMVHNVFAVLQTQGSFFQVHHSLL